MNTIAAAVDALGTFADPTRLRLVALLARVELSVAEITTITELPQSSVSNHLARLRDASIVRDRRAGVSVFYSLNDGTMPAPARSAWELLHKTLEDAVLSSDRARCESVLRAREKSAGFPDAFAGEMERHYSPGRTWESMARSLLGLVRLGSVLDVGCGDGALAQLLAPRAGSLTLLDHNPAMLDAARKRLRGHENVRAVEGDAAAMPFDDAKFDHVLLFQVLTLTENPARVLTECARVLRPGATLAIATLAKHDHQDVAAQWGHVHPGFTPAWLARALRGAGLSVDTCAISSRERRAPHFEVVTAFARRPTAKD